MLLEKKMIIGQSSIGFLGVSISDVAELFFGGSSCKKFSSPSGSGRRLRKVCLELTLSIPLKE